MSNNYRTNKPNPTSNFPVNTEKLRGEGAAGFSRVEEWLTPDRIKDEFLFGIPLVSLTTGQKLSDKTIKNIINRAAAKLETKCKIDVFPTQRVHREDFDRTKYLQGWNQLQLPFGNLQSLQEVSIRASNSLSFNHGVPSNNPYAEAYNVPSNGQTYPTTPNQQQPPYNPGSVEGDALYIVPLDWIDMSKANKGLLHFVPLQTTFSSYGVVGPSAGVAAPLFAVFSQLQWVPSFWFIKYTCGFQENSIPAPVNELIGAYAAMEILSLLGPTIKHNSQSISMDGASQSTSGPGNQLFALRYTQLQEQSKDLEDLIKSRFGKKVFMSHI